MNLPVIKEVGKEKVDLTGFYTLLCFWFFPIHTEEK